MGDLKYFSSLIFLFALAFERAANLECGGSLEGRTGTFRSPSYDTPDTASNESCEWRITAKADERIYLTINSDIEKNEHCNVSYVEVRDGHWHDSPLLGRFCGEDSFGPVRSSGDKMFVSYVYKNIVDHRGFLAEYESLCGSDLFVEKEQNLTSPDYPERYPDDKKCIWRIEVPELKQAVISFQTFDLEVTDTCDDDYVVLRDEWTSQSNLLGVYCNQSSSFQIMSSTNRLLVEFASDESVRRNGFFASVQAEYNECLSENDCEQVCINTIGSYRCECNPGYHLAPNGKDCEVDCGGILNTISGSIESPPFSGIYPLNDSCVWEIVALPQNQVTIQFTQLDIDENVAQLPEAPRCGKDKVSVYTVNGNGTFELQGDYCGTVIPDVIYSGSGRVRIVFSSYYSNKSNQFALDYVAALDGCSINEGNCQWGCLNTTGITKCVCGGNYTLQENNLDCVDIKSSTYSYNISSFTGNITSNHYPNGYDSADGWWKFMTTPGQRVQISFQSFYTYKSYDIVTLYDGPSSKNPVIGTFSGSDIPPDVVSSRNEMLIIFKTSGYSSQYLGFLATYSPVCGGNLSATVKEQYIYSHVSFGHSEYDNNTDCTWIITATKGNFINLKFDIFQLENSKNCLYDSVEIFDGDESLGKFCDDKPVPEIISKQTSVKIRFRTDEAISKNGFGVTYKAIKNSTIL